MHRSETHGYLKLSRSPRLRESETGGLAEPLRDARDGLRHDREILVHAVCHLGDAKRTGSGAGPGSAIPSQ